jgi:hypothetical protein
MHMHTIGMTEAALLELATQRGAHGDFTCHSPGRTCRRCRLPIERLGWAAAPTLRLPSRYCCQDSGRSRPCLDGCCAT